MPIPENSVKYYEKDLLDHVIDSVVEQEGVLTQSDLNKVSVAAQVQSGIDKFRAQAREMNASALSAEEHKSALLGRHLEEVGYRRPPRCHAHAIVAGKHHLASPLRAVMAKLKIRIDDPDNGCWLPENTAATPHPAFPRAVPHSRIHRRQYYAWIFSSFHGIFQEPFFRVKLGVIASQLQQGTLPKHVLAPKSVKSSIEGSQQ